MQGYIAAPPPLIGSSAVAALLKVGLPVLHLLLLQIQTKSQQQHREGVEEEEEEEE